MKTKKNIIVVGGPVAVGKSSLLSALPFVKVNELEHGDNLQKILLEKAYLNDKIAAQLFQLDMMLTRFDKYVQAAKSRKMHAFDRFIVEDIYFAWQQFGKNKNVWQFYKGLWDAKMQIVTQKIGRPYLYVLLSCDWQVFKERLFERNRSVEVQNFEKNLSYFRRLHEGYMPFVTKVLKKFRFNYVVVDTDRKSAKVVAAQVKEILKNKGVVFREQKG